MSKKKMFRVYAWEETTWETNIEAENQKEAEDKAYKLIQEIGFTDWDVGSHGNTEIMEVEELGDAGE
jgi:hypothetical protein